MRKVTSRVVNSFLAGGTVSVGNSQSTGDKLLLHGNMIAERMPDGSIMATLAGWPTVTTRERLNGLCESLGLGRPFTQKRHCQFFGWKPISSTETIVLVRPNGQPVTEG
jgi:hypothetical protein